MDYLQYLKRFNKNIKILNENELEKNTTMLEIYYAV